MIENQQVYVTYIADGEQRQWEFPYQFVDETDISLYIKHGDEFTKIEPSLCEFDPDTKKCTYPKDSEESPVPQGDIVLLTRETDITQLEDSSIANFKSTDVERMADKLTIIDQELKEELDRCIKYNQVDAIGADTDASDFFELFEEYADDAIDTHNTSETAHTARFTAKQDVIEDLSTIRSNATAGKSAKDAVDAMGDIISHDTDEFATAAQGTKADSAIQQADLNITALNDVSISSPSAAQVLAYDATTQKWKNSSSTASVAWGGVTGTLSDQTDLQSALNSKQATISDLETIRSGAALGATAVQPAAISNMLETTDVTSSYSPTGTDPVNGTAIASAISTKADLDLSNVPSSKGILVENYVNGTSWYRVYSDGWCEQGGYVTDVTSTEASITFLKEMANANYTALALMDILSDSGAVYFQLSVYSRSTTGMQITRTSGSTRPSQPFSWEVKGYLAQE